MRIGSLVTLANPWQIGGFRIGIIISKGYVYDHDLWTVLWATNGNPEVVDHIDHSLVEVK